MEWEKYSHLQSGRFMTMDEKLYKLLMGMDFLYPVFYNQMNFNKHFIIKINGKNVTMFQFLRDIIFK